MLRYYGYLCHDAECTDSFTFVLLKLGVLSSCDLPLSRIAILLGRSSVETCLSTYVRIKPGKHLPGEIECLLTSSLDPKTGWYEAPSMLKNVLA